MLIRRHDEPENATAHPRMNESTKLYVVAVLAIVSKPSSSREHLCVMVICTDVALVLIGCASGLRLAIRGSRVGKDVGKWGW